MTAERDISLFAISAMMIDPDSLLMREYQSATLLLLVIP